MKTRLNDLKCKSLLKTPGKYGDGNNLWLVVGQNQLAKWVLRYTISGHRREMGLGTYPQVPLKDARNQALLHLNEVRHGRDPINERATRALVSQKPTFKDCADQYITNQRDGWRNAKHKQQWANTISQYCGPILKKPVDQITQDDVLAILNPIWTTKNETASRLRGRIEKIIGYAIAAKHRTEANPAILKGSLEYLLPKVKRTVLHRPSLPWREMKRFWSELQTQGGKAKDALAFLILTAARSSEVREMTWKEVDFANATWTVPGHRMKLGVTHTVPLTTAAIKFLKSQKIGAPDEFVFRGNGRKNPTMSDMTLAAVIKRMNKKAAAGMGYYDPDGRQACPHGFRSSFRIWAAEESGLPRDVAEFALSHKLPDEVEAAYQRSTLFVKRVQLMQDWSTYLASA